MQQDNDMKLVGGVWLPVHEQHMVEWMKERNEVVDGKLTYQYHKLTAALRYVKQFRAAVDIGAHCGFWSQHLVKRFDYVHAFEPVELHRRCFMRNVSGNVTLYPFALGEREGMIAINTTKGSSGDSRVDDKVVGEIPLKRLDDVLDIGIPVDFLKADCEGYELFALRGAEEMLRHWRPVLCVEQKHQFGGRYGVDPRAAITFLQGLGARLRQEISGDFIMSWD